MEEWSKILDLLEVIEKKLEINKKMEEMEQAFVREFGLKPQKLSVEKALSKFKDGELPENIRCKIYDLLNDLDYKYDYFKLYIQVYRTISDESYDWKVTAGPLITLEKRENGLCYELEIFPIVEPDDC